MSMLVNHFKPYMELIAAHVSSHTHIHTHTKAYSNSYTHGMHTLSEYLSKAERRESESNYENMGSRDLIGESFTPPDSGMNGDDDDQGWWKT